MHEAFFYEKKKDKSVDCRLCPWKCSIKNGYFGTCTARKNINGTLYSLVYAKPCSVAVDPVEKKPLFHFFPGSKILSVGTFGCNLFCMGCQNYDVSKGDTEIYADAVLPSRIVEIAKREGVNMIAFTYNEPTIFYEYMLDIAKLAKKEEFKTVVVSNGYINPEPLKELCKYIDAFNIDLKFFNDKTYLKYCKTKLEPVLESIKIIKQEKCWLEITQLLIEGLNDKPEEVEAMCRWIKENAGDVPLHFSRFYPMYKAEDYPVTRLERLEMAKRIAQKYLSHVYIGNMRTEDDENTYCPNCKELLVARNGYRIQQNNMEAGRCRFCKAQIEGVWD